MSSIATTNDFSRKYNGWLYKNNIVKLCKACLIPEKITLYLSAIYINTIFVSAYSFFTL